MISLRLLGPVEISIDGHAPPPELLWRKHLGLFVYLLRSPGRCRPREHLAAVLWGDHPDAAARHSLNEALRALRRAFGPDAVRSDGEQVALALRPTSVDLDELERALESEALEEAARLVRGPFARVGAARVAADRGEIGAASDLARRAIDLEPSSDVAIGALMRAMALAGDREGALAQFERHRVDLEQLDRRLSPELVALAGRIRSERGPRPIARERSQRLATRRFPLVGRDVELSGLLAAWREAARGSHSLPLLIVGDQGSGKTRLIEELAARVRLEGGAVAKVRAVEADSSLPDAGLLALATSGLDEVPGVASAPPAALAGLSRRSGVWAERFPAVPDAEPLELGRALAEVTRAAAAEQPLLIAIDDAEWLDRESLLWLAALVRELERVPIAMLLAAAPTPARDELVMFRQTVASGGTGFVKLAGLQSAVIRQLAALAVPSYDSDALDRLARRVERDSAGLPLLVVELLHAVSAGLELGLMDATWPRPFHTLSQTFPADLPEPVIAAVRVGFRRLSRPAQQALAACAVLGDPVAEPRLESATGLSRQEIGAALDELEWARWLQADRRGYAFVGRIVREVVLRDLVTQGQRLRIEASGR
jgi:DNA-binding SARP family transcriptional activator